jgi:glycine betaine/proline transport system permease protein
MNMWQDVLLTLPWLAIGAAFVYLIYITVTPSGALPDTSRTWASLALVVVTLLWATYSPSVGELLSGEAVDQIFPEIINTRPIRFWLDDSLKWVVRNWGGHLEAAAYPLLRLLLWIERGLLAIPWWLSILIFTGLAFLSTRRWTLPVIVAVSLIFLGLMELWEDAVETMALMIAATLTAIIISIPVGIAMSRWLLVRRIVTPVLDLMQTLPSFVYLIPTVMIFGPGKVPALLATIIYASPPLARLTDLGLRLVDPDIMEAARAFGTTPRQRLFGVQIPLAMPTILAGINQTTMMALAMVVIASMIGAGGLGYQVLQGIGRLEVSRGLFAGLGIVVLAIIFDRVTQAFGRQLQERIGLSEVRT